MQRMYNGSVFRQQHPDSERLPGIGAGLTPLVSGELKRYNETMDKAPQIVTERMVEEAQRLGADAIVGARYTTSAIMHSAAEVMAYGTAVKVR